MQLHVAFPFKAHYKVIEAVRCLNWYKSNAHFQSNYYKQHKLGSLLGMTTKSVCTLIIQLIFLQQHFLILMLCNITGTGVNACVIAWALGLCDILVTTMCFN